MKRKQWAREEDRQALRRPSAVYWRAENERKADTMASRKKSSSGGTTSITANVQAIDDRSKENRVPSVNKKTHQRRPSLKELCPEDKARVKSLIEKLAQTSSEKEAMEDRVKEERRQFTTLLDKLKEQHHKVVKEKKELESELHASQLQLQAIHTYPPSSSSSSSSSHPPLSRTETSPIKSAHSPSYLTSTGSIMDPVTSVHPPPHFTFMGSTTDPVTSTDHYPPFQESTTNTTTSSLHSSQRMTSGDHNLPPTAANPVVSSLLKQIPLNISTPPDFVKSSQKLSSTWSTHPASLLKHTTLPSRYQHPRHPLSAPTNSTPPPSIHAYYPEYSPAPSTNSTVCNSTGIAVETRRGMAYPQTDGESQHVDFGDHQTAQRSRVNAPCLSESGVNGLQVKEMRVAYPTSFTESLSTATDKEQAQQRSMIYPQSLTDSFSITTVNQGAPLSSTRVQQECQAGPAFQEACHKALQVSGDSKPTPSWGQGHMTLNNASHTEDRTHNLTMETNTRDKTHQVDIAEPVSPPKQASIQPWLSLPVATPDKTSSHNEKKREVLFHEEQSGGSRREIGTQTLRVESVSTQTDNEDKRNLSNPVIKQTMDAASTSPTPTKGGTEPAAVSVGDMSLPSATADNTPQIESSYEHTCGQVRTSSRGRQETENRTEGHTYATPELSQDEVVLVEELLSTSELLSNHSELSGRLRISQRFADLGAGSKRIEASTFEPLSPLELAASLNSQNNPSSLLTSIGQFYTRSHQTHASLSTSLEDSLNTITRLPLNPPHNAHSDSDTEDDSRKLCLDDSELIEELFFI